MKLRFRRNSLRLRLNRREVEQLAAGAALHEEVKFPGDARMEYALHPSSDSRAAATFQGGVIRVHAPHTQVQDWANGEEIGLYFDLPTDSAPLKVAIEKDLECVDGPAEERDPEAYPRVAGTIC
jgi:hypothetical protein